jgi:hypothetical protein
MTASEIQFMKAEALYYKGNKTAALAAYTQAINLNFDQLISDYEAFVPASLRMTAASRAAYLADPNVIPTDPNNLNLSRILLQKYIALYGWGGIETWVDLRRYHYNKDAEGTDTVYWKFEVPSLTDLWPTNNGNFVQRCFPRGASEFYNLPEFYKVGGSRADYHTIEMWFSQE